MGWKDYQYEWKNLSQTVTVMANEIAKNYTGAQILGEIAKIESGHSGDATAYLTGNGTWVSTTADAATWFNGVMVDGNFQSEYTKRMNELKRGRYEQYYITNNQEDEMEMPFYYVCLSNGQIVDKAKEEADAKRKATTYAAANKCDAYVLKAVSRFQPKDVPVEEVAL